MAGKATYTEPVTQAQHEQLIAHIDSGFSEIKSMLGDYERRLREVETREAGCQPVLQGRLAAVEKKQTEHDETIKKLVIVSDRLENISKWLLGIFTALVVIIAGAYLTGGITIVFNH